MRQFRIAILLAGVTVTLSQFPETMSAQGKGQGKGQGGEAQGKGRGGKAPSKAKGQGQGQGRGKGAAAFENRGRKEPPSSSGRSAEGRGNSGTRGAAMTSDSRGQGKGSTSKFARLASHGSMPASVRKYSTSRRAQDLIMAAVVSHAFARGRGDEIRIDEVGNAMRLRNRNGDPLVLLDDESARDLGRWRVGVLDDEVREGSPAFCRSGAGHPVWGRQWCLDKGFGIGSYDDYRWGRTDDLGDIAFSGGNLGTTLVSSALARLVGTNTFNRLALHAVTLGLVEPLTGRWVTDRTGPQVLMVNSGVLPVAELVDVNRDNRADNMIVALRSW